MKTDINQYEISIFWSAEDECFIAKVPALRGCISHGETLEEAAANIREAMEGYIESMEAHGDAIPNSDTTVIRLRKLKPFIKIRQLAKKAGMNPSTLASKVERGGPFSKAERSRIEKALTF